MRTLRINFWPRRCFFFLRRQVAICSLYTVCPCFLSDRYYNYLFVCICINYLSIYLSTYLTLSMCRVSEGKLWAGRHCTHTINHSKCKPVKFDRFLIACKIRLQSRRSCLPAWPRCNSYTGDPHITFHRRV